MLRPDVRALLYAKHGASRLGWVSTASVVSAASLTDAQWVGNNLLGDNEWNARWVYLPTESGTNRVKPMGTVGAAGVWAHAATTNWSGLGTSVNAAYESLVVQLHPDVLNQLIADAMRLLDFPVYEVMSDLEDGSMNAADASAWVAGVAGMNAPVKVNADNYNQTGFWSLYQANVHASDYYTHAVKLKVAPGQQRYVAPSVVVDTGGPPTLTVRDYTHGTTIATVTGVTGFLPQRLWTTYTVPADCYQVEYRLGMTAANSVGAWDCLASHNLGDRYVKLPGFINQGRRLIDLVEASYDETIASNVTTVASKRYQRFARGQRWETENLGEEANPNAVQVYGNRPLPANDLLYYARRPWWDKTPLTDETLETNAPQDELMAAVNYMLGRHMSRETGDSYWADVEAEFKDKFNAELITQREPEPPPAKQTLSFGRASSGRWR